MYEPSPWGSSDDADLPPLPAISVPHYSPETSTLSAWPTREDSSISGNGWGTAEDVDDHPQSLHGLNGGRDEGFSVGGTASTSASAAQPFTTSARDDGWGTTSYHEDDNAGRATSDLTAELPESAAAAPTVSPRLPLAPPPASPSLAQRISRHSFDTSAAVEAPASPVTVERESDWGNHGSEAFDLPLSTVNAGPRSPEAQVGRGWDHYDDPEEWRRKESEQVALPSFGDSFVQPRSAEQTRVDGNEGWSSGTWEERDRQRGQEQEEVDTEPKDLDAMYRQEEGTRRSLNVPAAFIDNLKSESQRFSSTSWSVSGHAFSHPDQDEDRRRAQIPSLLSRLNTPPELAPELPVKSTTPLSSLFRLSPSIRTAFNDGLDKTALKAAETLQGTSSTVYRNARFARGRASTAAEEVMTKVQDLARAGDEYDVDVEDRAPKSRWWSSNSTPLEPAAPNVPPRGLLSRESTRPITPTLDQSAEISSAHSSPDTAPSAIGRFLGRFSKPPITSASSSSSRPASPLDADALDDFFGSVPPAPRNHGTAQAVEPEFDDFLGALGDVKPTIKQVIPQQRIQHARKAETFDPFGLDEEVFAAVPVTLVPLPARRPATSVPPPQAQAQDSFDSFFTSSVPPPLPQPRSTTSPLHSGTTAAPPRILPRLVVAANSNPVPSYRSSSPAVTPAVPSAMPPPRSSTPSKGFSLLPPPRGFSVLAPPPAPAVSSSRNSPDLVPVAPSAVSTPGKGGLSLAELSFFESM